MNNLINTYVGMTWANPFIKSFRWLTDVVRYDNAQEVRNKVWTQPMREWSVNWPILPATNRGNLIKLYQKAGGRFRTFLFEDDDEYEGSCEFTQVKYDITAADVDAETFTIAGKYTSIFVAGVTFEVRGSTGNDSNWVVTSSSYVGTNTVIIVTGNIGNATGDGRILVKDFQLFTTYYDGETEEWDENRKDIQAASITGDKGTTAIVEGAGNDYTLDDTTGVVRFNDDKAPESIDIASATAATDTFTVAEDITAFFAVDDKFVVTGSTANDGTYTIASISFGGGVTTIVTDEDFAGDEDDGVINQWMDFDYEYYFRIRFDSDGYVDNQKWPNHWKSGDLKLVEVKS